MVVVIIIIIIIEERESWFSEMRNSAVYYSETMQIPEAREKDKDTRQDANYRICSPEAMQGKLLRWTVEKVSMPVVA